SRDRIPQSTEYHRFADQRTLLGIPHALNVLSNVPFLLVGVAGLLYLTTPEARRAGGTVDEPIIRVAYLCLFAGVGLTAFGSTYYHLDPTNKTLVWDRLPMTV